MVSVLLVLEIVSPAIPTEPTTVIPMDAKLDTPSLDQTPALSVSLDARSVIPLM